MKNKINLILVALLLFIIVKTKAQVVAINNNGAAANAKALLDVDATGLSPKTGVLVPRLTTAERNAITAPIPTSLLIFNTTTTCFEAWNQSTNTWVPFGCIGCGTPTTTAASGIANTSFGANWVAASGATSYVIDVSLNSGFSTFVTGYNNLNVGNVTTKVITGLTANTTYYVRVRALNGCGVSVSSNTTSTTTLP